jgi:hypothetical protein
MHRTISLLGAVLCGLLLTTACSHPLPKLAYPDGRNRIPINTPRNSPPMAYSAAASDAAAAADQSVSSAPAGARP